MSWRDIDEPDAERSTQGLERGSLRPGLFPDTILLGVIECKAKGITKCSKCSLRGVSLGSL
jgi:hypothetical protein